MHRMSFYTDNSKHPKSSFLLKTTTPRIFILCDFFFGLEYRCASNANSSSIRRLQPGCHTGPHTTVPPDFFIPPSNTHLVAQSTIPNHHPASAKNRRCLLRSTLFPITNRRMHEYSAYVNRCTWNSIFEPQNTHRAMMRKVVVYFSAVLSSSFS